MQQYKIFLTSLVFSLFVYTHNLKAEQQLLDQAIATVNNEVITLSELQEEITAVEKRIANLPEQQRPSANELKAVVLDNMINALIAIDTAKRMNLDVSDEELNAIIKQNHISFDNGDEVRAKNKLKDAIIVQKLHQAIIANKVKVSDKEVSNYLKSQRSLAELNITFDIQQYVITPNKEPITEQDWEKAIKFASYIHNKIKNNEKIDFAQDPNFTIELNNLQNRGINSMPDMFVEKIKDLNINEVSPLIKTSRNIHILHIKDIKINGVSAITQESHIRHILLFTNEEMSNKQAEEKLTAIRQEIIDGADFAEMAKKYSQDPGSKENGGDLGWAEPSRLDPTFAEQAAATKVGEISNPFKSSFGWHIVEVLDRKQENDVAQTIKKRALQHLHNLKAEENIRSWLKEVRDTYSIRIL